MQVAELAFERFGDMNQSPLIILHGFFASSRNWRQIAEKLAYNFCVYVLDARNHGNSPHCEIMDYDTMAEDVAYFITQNELKNVTLLGHSMGGKTAMWLALNLPDLIQNLIVIDIAPVAYKHSFDPIINSLKNLPLSELSNRKQADVLLSEIITDLSYRQFLLQNLILKSDGYMWRINLDFFQKNAPAIIDFPNSDVYFPFEKPTLFLAGQNSKYIPSGSTQLLFPRAHIVTISNAEHWIHVQNPDDFLTAVRDFLS